MRGAFGSTLRGRVLLVLVVAFIPLLALEAYLLDAQAGTLRQRILDERRALARSEAQAASSFIAGKIDTLVALSFTTSVSDPASGNLDSLLRSVTQSDPSWLTVALSGADGFNLSSLTTPARSVNISDRDYFQGALAGKPTVGTALLTRSTGAKSLVLAVPVAIAGGGKGVLSGALSLTNAEKELRQSLRAGTELVVVDRKGQQFIGPGIGETFPVLAGRAPVDAALRGEEGAEVTDIEGVPTVVAFAGAGLPGWGVILREPAAAAFAEIERERGTTFAVSAVAAAVALILVLFLGSRLDRTYAAVESAREDLERSREEATRERDRLERVVAEMPIAVAIYDQGGRAVVRNETYRKLLGGAPPTGVEETLRYYHARRPDGRALTVADHPTPRALRGEAVRGEEVVLDQADTGGEVHILVNALPFREGDDVVGALVVFQDITEIKAVERERSAFFDMASHEIKTPLTSLIGHVQLALRRAREGRFERIEDVLARAEVGGRRLSDLVRDLLDVSRLAEGRFEMQRERVELGALVTSVIDEISVSVTQHEIAFDRSGDMLWVDADPRRLVQVIQNLLDNAVRYSPAGGRIDVSLRRERDRAVVSVADRGLGIPEDERDQLFQRFFRTTRTQSYGGTGLGLYISRRIAERHGGALELERSGPEGSVFVLSLPLGR